MSNEVKYVYKAMANYYSTLSDAKSALKMDGWTPKEAKKAGIVIYKIDIKTRKQIKKHYL